MRSRKASRRRAVHSMRRAQRRGRAADSVTDDSTARGRRRPVRGRRVGCAGRRGGAPRAARRSRWLLAGRARAARGRARARDRHAATGSTSRSRTRCRWSRRSRVLVAWASGCLRTLPGVRGVVLPVAAIARAAAGRWSRTRIASRTPASRWAAAHIAVALVAYALFVVAALQALLMTGLEKRLHRGTRRRRGRRRPPLLTLERYLFRLVGAGFVLLTLTLASGVAVLRAAVRQAVRRSRTRTCSRSSPGSRSARCCSAAGATAGAAARR